MDGSPEFHPEPVPLYAGFLVGETPQTPENSYTTLTVVTKNHRREAPSC